ncbi:MAG: hypothetical protein ACI4AD_12720 [Roseburia sp.]
MDVDYKELAIEVGYSYLNGGYGCWEDGAGKIHSYDSMDNEYLNNCINFVDRGIKEIKNNEYEITKDIKRQLSKMIENPSEKDIKHAKRQIVEILKEKKQELKDCKKRRKSF